MIDLIYRAPNGVIEVTDPPVCNGTLLSHSQYKIDLDSGWFKDGRLKPHGRMNPVELVDATISTDDPKRREILAAVNRQGCNPCRVN